MAIDLSRSASGMTTMKFFAPPSAWTRLPACEAVSVDVPRDGRRADERHALDVRVLAEPVDDVRAAVHEVHDAAAEAALREQLEHPLLRERHELGRLHDERVAGRDREREEPERHHGGEVERRDRREDADRLAVDVAVEPRAMSSRP